MRSEKLRMQDILDSIQKIEDRTKLTEAQFEQDEMLQVWVLHHLQIIGEASAHLTEETRNRLRHFPWKDIISMRSIIVHHYFDIDARVVWNTAKYDLTALKDGIESLLKES